MDKSSGILTLNGTLDAEKTDFFRVTVRVSLLLNISQRTSHRKLNGPLPLSFNKKKPKNKRKLVELAGLNSFKSSKFAALSEPYSS